MPDPGFGHDQYQDRVLNLLDRTRVGIQEIIPGWTG